METQDWYYTVADNENYITLRYGVEVPEKELYYNDYNNGYGFYDDISIWKYKNVSTRMNMTNRDAHPID
jgi:hypothetical protein